MVSVRMKFTIREVINATCHRARVVIPEEVDDQLFEQCVRVMGGRKNRRRQRLIHTIHRAVGPYYRARIEADEQNRLHQRS